MTITRNGGTMIGQEVVTGNIEFYTLYTTLNLSVTGNFRDPTQKDFESVVQVIGLRAMPIMMNNPVHLDGVTYSLENYGAPTLTGEGWIYKFAFEREGVHTIETLTNELHGIVLNGGTVDTKNTVNMEFTKQDMI